MTRSPKQHPIQTPLSRRDFFTRWFQRAEKIVSERSQPRPPGALEETDFLATCTKCLQCALACPMNIIQKDAKGLPTLMIEYTGCDGCGQCIAHCPTQALLPQTKMDTQLRPIHHPDHCHALTCRCTLCMEACQVNAIEFNADQFQLNDSLCTGCGDCFIVCDNQAITLSLNVKKTY